MKLHMLGALVALPLALVACGGLGSDDGSEASASGSETSADSTSAITEELPEIRYYVVSEA